MCNFAKFTHNVDILIDGDCDRCCALKTINFVCFDVMFTFS